MNIIKRLRKTAIVLDAGFRSRDWLNDLFSNVINFENTTQITTDCVVVFEGGTDISSHLYLAQQGKFTQPPDKFRDAHEAMVFRRAMIVGASCLGICRGAQLLTALNNGKLFQDVTGHQRSHPIFIPEIKGFKDSDTELISNSAHHQMMNPFNLPEDKYRILAYSAPAVSTRYLNGFNSNEFIPPVEPEIIWYPDSKCLGIQGHPEWAAGAHKEFLTLSRDLVTHFAQRH